MKVINDKKFPFERALYAYRDILLHNCVFDGAEDGESALKETKNVEIQNCRFNLRYPLWHAEYVDVENSAFTDKCRAALWYSRNISINASVLNGIKAVRECVCVNLSGCRVNSPEFGWKSSDISVINTEIEGEYPFFMSRDIVLTDVSLKGKYSFQYVENAVVKNCIFDTKDAFWHAKNVTVENSVIRGEYFSWYSENLTLINCNIIGTQPLCYCKGLNLVNCKMEDADFAFEYSDVQAQIIGEIISIKNPLSGKITADKIGEVILTDDSVYKSKCIIEGGR